MITVQKLVEDVATARNQFVNYIADVTEIQAVWKSSPEQWNIIKITEHLFWAEQGGIFRNVEDLFSN